MTRETEETGTPQVTWGYIFEPLIWGLLWAALMIAAFGFLAILEWVIGHVV